MKNSQSRAPTLPDVACSILKGVIASLASTGLINGADAEAIMRLLALGDSFNDRDASLEIDRLIVENERLAGGGK